MRRPRVEIVSPTDKATTLEIDGHEVRISNPDKVVFPEPGLTKLDLVHYYLAVADGALRGVGGRPMVLKRFVKGIEAGGVLPEAGAREAPGVDRHGDAQVRLGQLRRRGRRAGRSGARVGGQPRLPRPQPAPGTGGGPRPARRAAHRPRPDARRGRGGRSSRSRSWPARCSPTTASWAGRRPPAPAACTSMPASSRVGLPRRAPRRRDPRPRGGEPRARPRHRRWWKEERGESVFVDFNQNAKDRTVASAYSIRPRPTRGSRRRSTGTRCAAASPSDSPCRR